MKPTVDEGARLVDPNVKRRRVRLLVTIVLVGTLASIVWHYVSSYYVGQGYPRSTFLFIPADHFNDWNNLYIGAQEFLRGVPWQFGYFPFGGLATVTTTVLPTTVGLILMIVLFLSVLAVMLRRWVLDCDEHPLTKAQGIVILVGLSYPVLFVLDRANVEMLIFVFIAGFFYFTYVRECAWMAALCLAAAIAFKLYPATLLLLLLAERRFKPLVLTVIIAGGLTAISVGLLAVVGHYSLADVWQMNAGGIAQFQQTMVIDGDGVAHSHTLWGLVGLLQMLRQHAVAGWQTTLYEVAAAAAFLVLAVHAVFRETERWKLVLLATVPWLLLPYVSFDYTLIQLYFPLVFFLNARRVSRWDVVYVALFGILLVPVDYYYVFPDNNVLHDMSISVIIYPASLVALVLLAILDVQRAAGHNNAERSENRGAERGRAGEACGAQSTPTKPATAGRLTSTRSPEGSGLAAFHWRTRTSASTERVGVDTRAPEGPWMGSTKRAMVGVRYRAPADKGAISFPSKTYEDLPADLSALGSTSAIAPMS
jgi:hypothetical protein